MVWKAILAYPFVNFRRLYNNPSKRWTDMTYVTPCEWMSSRNITGSKTHCSRRLRQSHFKNIYMTLCTNMKKAQQIIQVVSQINLWSTFFYLNPSIVNIHAKKIVCCNTPVKSTRGNPNVNFSAWRYGNPMCRDGGIHFQPFRVLLIKVDPTLSINIFHQHGKFKKSMKNSRHHNWSISLKYCGAASLSRFFLVFISMKWCNSLAEAAKSWHWRALKDAGFLQGWGG